ncbi:putative integrase core domain containing protein [Lyophyllum shimeji]|uniref:RNA-directed DNA polymerase n=1 Tax=Lyophyllum shimeji TaxID=47721 RepID=A0A9P3UV05_LYOSH|nr:putative integrase core domain containing protein [Lyophyllum shimeji]
MRFSGLAVPRTPFTQYTSHFASHLPRRSPSSPSLKTRLSSSSQLPSSPSSPPSPFAARLRRRPSSSSPPSSLRFPSSFLAAFVVCGLRRHFLPYPDPDPYTDPYPDPSPPSDSGGPFPFLSNSTLAKSGSTPSTPDSVFVLITYPLSVCLGTFQTPLILLSVKIVCVLHADDPQHVIILEPTARDLKSRRQTPALTIRLRPRKGNPNRPEITPENIPLPESRPSSPTEEDPLPFPPPSDEFQSLSPPPETPKRLRTPGIFASPGPLTPLFETPAFTERRSTTPPISTPSVASPLIQSPPLSPMAHNPIMSARGHPTAPTFSTNGPELLRFFEDLEFLFSDCNIADDQMKKRYTVRYVDVATNDLWINLDEYANPRTYAEWKTAVVALYPGTSQDRRYTMADLDLLVGERNRLGIYSVDDLAAFHRTFLTITSFLISRQRFTERERDQQYKRAFRDEFWNQIQRRLEILFPNHDLDTPYSMANIKASAEYLLQAGIIRMAPPAAPATPGSAPGVLNVSPGHTSAAAPGSGVSVKTEEFSLLIEKLTQTIDRLNSPSSGGSGGRPPRPRDCAMCGQTGHLIGECPAVEQYTQEGKCRRNAEGRVVLPSGAFVPSTIREPGNIAAGRLSANTNAGQMMLEVMQLRDVTAEGPSTAERIEALEREILALRKEKQVFDGVEIPRRKPFSKSTPALVKPAAAHAEPPRSTPPVDEPIVASDRESQTSDKGKGKRVEFADPPRSKTPPPSSVSATDPPPPPAPAPASAPAPAKPASRQPPVHPFSGIPENRYVPPTSRNLGAVDRNKSADGPAYRTVAPIVDTTKSGAIFGRCLDSQVVVSVGELCSVAPEIRGKFREAVTPKRTTGLASVIEEVDEDAAAEELEALPLAPTPDPPAGALVLEDPYEMYLKTLKPGEYPERLTVAKESHSLRAINLFMDDQEDIEAIVDSGCQIVAMSEEVCHDLGIQYDPTIVLNMQSANGTVDSSLGLARNVPCSVGPVTLYLQIHVIRNPAYDVLLGRLFDVVTCSNVKTYADDHTVITITDPNTGAVVSIPTFPRGRRRRMIGIHGDVALVITYDSRFDSASASAFARLPPTDTPSDTTSDDPGLSHLYLCASRLFATLAPRNSFLASIPTTPLDPVCFFGLPNSSLPSTSTHFSSVSDFASDPVSATSPVSQPSSAVLTYTIPKTDTYSSNHFTDTTYSSSRSLPTLPSASFPALPPASRRPSDFFPAGDPDTDGLVTVNQVKVKGVQVKKKYKPVARKVRSVVAGTPENFHIKREIKGDPLADMPALDPNPPPFTPTGRYTQERMEQLDKEHPGFLWPDERRLMHDFMCKQNAGFAWNDSERGRFREDFFPPVDIPVVPHTPWIERNIPIPPGIYNEFCVLKKNGKLRIVHSLEPLNRVTIRHSGVTPFPDHVAEQFAGRVCGAMLDLYIGYDERLIAAGSRDLTTFQTPFGALRLVTLPMGWTNSVPVFHDDVTYILQPEIPDHTLPYIDDVAIKGPEHWYLTADGTPETIPENPGIRRAIWEFFQDVNRIVQRMKYSGSTFSGHKLSLCVERFKVLGHVCTPQGRVPDDSRLDLLKNWGPCATISELRAFLGTVGVLRIFVRNFAHRAHHLVKLTRKGVSFEFGPDQVAAQRDIVHALEEAQPLVPIQYDSPDPVILAVDTSYIAVGFFLCQADADNRKLRRYNRFGSITLNERESRFSQPKLELYGLFRAMQALRLYIIGVRNLVVEVDARYIKGMLANPDIQPSASINRWIVAILMFHFELVHVKGTFHGPDGLSRRPRQPGDPDPEPEAVSDFEDWVDRMHGFMHIIQPLRRTHPPSTVQILATAQISSEEESSGTPVPAEPPEPRLHNTDEAQLTDPEAGHPELTYADVPRSPAALVEEHRVELVRQWHADLKRPAGLSDSDYAAFVRYATQFFLDGPRLWRRHRQGAHQLVVRQESRIGILRSVHDGLGHRRFFATRAMLLERFWWPHVHADIVWFVRTCHICQIQQTGKVLIPPTVATPAPLFAKVYIDTMHMPSSHGYAYIVQGRCSLAHWPEWRALRKENHKTIGEWLFEDIICRWGGLREIVTDNGPAFIKAVAYLAKKYHINFIRISGYNSRANGLVERPHFDVRQALFKAVDGVERRWFTGAYSVFWSERVTIRKRMGCSPYYAATGTHPLLPFDITEAIYLQPPPDSVLSSTDLIARRAVALQKRSEDLTKLHSDVYAARKKAALRFELQHARTIRNFDFKPGSLVLMRNTKIEKSLNRKMRPRYIGPLIVVSRNKGGAYIICELDGSVLHRPVAAFRLLPYFARRSIPFPITAIDIDTNRLRELEETNLLDDDSFPDISAGDEPGPGIDSGESDSD